MKTKKLLTTLAIVSVVLIAGCKKDKTTVVSAPIKYTVSLSSNPSAGGITSGGGTFKPDSSVTVIATPNAGYTFTNWTENGTTVSTNASYTFTISGNRTLVANLALPLQTNMQAIVNLRSNADFVILAGSLISNVPTSAVTGNIGLSPAAGSKITGFGGGEVTGTIYTVDASGPAGSVPAATLLTTAKGDLTTAYNDAAGRTSTDIVLLAGNIGGLTLTPGLYKSSGSLEITSGDLTFDAMGNANAIFIIQIASTLVTTSGRKVILSGGALASNIFWQVGTSATIGTTSVFKGTIMADQSISVNTGATIEGRLLARIAAVTLKSNIIVKP